MTIKTDMRELIKKETTEEKRFNSISKKFIFESVKGTDEDKQKALTQLLEDGEIFEVRPQLYKWLGA